MPCLIFLTHSEACDTEVVGDIVDDDIDETTIGGKRNEQVRINDKSLALRGCLQDRLPSLLVNPSALGSQSPPIEPIPVEQPLSVGIYAQEPSQDPKGVKEGEGLFRDMCQDHPSHLMRKL